MRDAWCGVIAANASPKNFSAIWDMWSYAPFCSDVRSEVLIGRKRSDILDVDFIFEMRGGLSSSYRIKYYRIDRFGRQKARGLLLSEYECLYDMLIYNVRPEALGTIIVRYTTLTKGILQ